jgi:CdiI N-terminal domain
MFAIELQSHREDGDGSGGSAEASGRIVIDDFTETFRAPLGFWHESDYRRSWRRAFEVLNANPHSTSCLMTSMTDPSDSNFLVCWPMYREDENVYLQNAMIFLDEIEEGFDPEMPWGYVGPRQTQDEDGNKISEWTTSVSSLRKFFG